MIWPGTVLEVLHVCWDTGVPPSKSNDGRGGWRVEADDLSVKGTYKVKRMKASCFGSRITCRLSKIYE